MREDYAIILRSPLQNSRIVSACNLRVLNADYILIGTTSQQPPNNVVIKILVGS